MSYEASEAFWAAVADDPGLESRVLSLIKGESEETETEDGDESLSNSQFADNAGEAVAALARSMGFDVVAEDVVDECLAVLDGPSDDPDGEGEESDVT